MSAAPAPAKPAPAAAPASAPAQDKQKGAGTSAKGTKIQQKTEISGNGTETGTNSVTAKADLQTEYVSATAGTQWWSDRYVRSLPNPTDRFMRSFGSKLYEEDMPLDPQVYSTLQILVMAVLAEGVQLTPALEADELAETPDPEAEQAQRINDFCQKNLDGLAHPLPQTLAQLVKGMLKVGHKVAEQVYEMRTLAPEDGPQIVLKDLKPKPFRSIAFVCDAAYNVLGLLYVKSGQTIASTGLLSTDVKDIPNLLPRDKFAIPTWEPENGDPRGRSHMQSVYTPWWKKQGLTQEHLAFIGRFANPSIIHELPPSAQRFVDERDADGNLTGRKLDTYEEAKKALLDVKGGGVLVHGKDGNVYLLEIGGDGQLFLSSYEHEDKQIAKGMLMQTLTTEEAKHMARAASTTHQDVFGIFIRFIRLIIEWMLRYDVLKPLVRYNFGEEAADRLVPKVSLGDTEGQDLAAMGNMIANLEKAGYLHTSMYPQTDNMLNLHRDMQAFMADREKMQALAEKAAQANNAPPGQDNSGDNPGNDGSNGDSGDNSDKQPAKEAPPAAKPKPPAKSKPKPRRGK